MFSLSVEFLIKTEFDAQRSLFKLIEKYVHKTCVYYLSQLVSHESWGPCQWHFPTDENVR